MTRTTLRCARSRRRRRLLLGFLAGEFPSRADETAGHGRIDRTGDEKIDRAALPALEAGIEELAAIRHRAVPGGEVHDALVREGERDDCVAERAG
jgi:hypothetical protein